MRSVFVQVYGLRTHALVLGQGKPLVLVPGLGCASWMYLRLARHLAKERTVYIYDPPGHGYSEGTWNYPTSIAHLTQHLAAWLRAMGLRRAPLLGHSLGGEVLFELAHRAGNLTPALIACAPTGVPDNPNVLVQALNLLRDLPHERPQLWPLGFRAYSVAGLRRMYLLARSQARHSAPLAAVRAPTLLLCGTQDNVINTAMVWEMRCAMPDAVVGQIAGAPHGLTDSHPRAIAAFTLDFLRALAEAGADWQEEMLEDLFEP